MTKSRYEPRKRTAIDGKIWWYAYDTVNNKFSTLLCHGKCKTKKDCIYQINNADGTL